MKYAIVLDDGRIELREDSSEALPVGAIELTDDEYSDIQNGVRELVSGVVK